MGTTFFSNKFFREWMQGFLARLITQLARVKMSMVTDSGTAIGKRYKLFSEIIPPRGIGVELGVYKGNLSHHILAVNRPSLLHLVDPWWEYEPEWHWAKGDSSTARSLAILILTLQRQVESGTVKIHIGGSIEVLAEFPEQYLDWAYIDSTHGYQQTFKELNSLKRTVKSNGIIAGDDWQEDENHPHHGVCKAVREFLVIDPTYELIFCEGGQWAIRQRP